MPTSSPWTLPLDLCAYVASEVAKGLDHAHRRRDEELRPLGIVHRDVSPQNILLSFEGEVKVTDFGIAKARGALELGDVDESGQLQIRGKFGYMSPEQARGDEVDARSDLFSLGVVLYECIAGVNPFSAPNRLETLRRVQAGEFPPIELLRPEAPPDLAAIVKTAMAKDPSARFGDAGRMYEALVAYLYAHGSRYSAHAVAQFLARFRAEDEVTNAPSTVVVDRQPDRDEDSARDDLTPVEVPVPRGLHLTRTEAGLHQSRSEHPMEVGERRDVTALVIEARWGESDKSAERTVALIERYGGRIYRRDATSLLALFGLGETDGRDAEMATRCALLSLRAFVGDFPPRASVHGGRIRVTSSGHAIEDERFSALVNEAKRFTRVEGRCVATVATVRLITSMFEFEPMAHPIGPPSAGLLVRDVRRASDWLGRFVGRHEELRKVGDVLAASAKRSARVLTLRGAHGIGKTRLLSEMERRLHKGRHNVGIYVASCPLQGPKLPLSGIATMLQVLCGVGESDSTERIVALQGRLRALGLHGEELAAVLSALGAHVPVSNARKTLLCNAFTQMLLSLCADRPHALAWDAAHCMDEESFALLDTAFQKLASSRVLFAFAVRAGFSHPLEKPLAHIAIEIGDLPPADAERLVAARLSVHSVPAELNQFVRERAGGHPQCIEELLKGLVDAYAVTVADGKVVSLRLLGQELAMPRTLRGLIAARLARLSVEERTVLQAASVLGESFEASVLAQMLHQPVSSLEATVATLQDRGLLVHTGPAAIRFTSPVISEVVLETMTAEAARQTHIAAGYVLASTLDECTRQRADRIAMHYYAGGDYTRAADYFVRSARQRVEARQFEAATRDYARAIELSDLFSRPAKDVAEWFRALASAVQAVRALPDSNEVCERVLARVDAAGDPALGVRALVDAAAIFAALHRFDSAGAHIAAAREVAGSNEELVKHVLGAHAELCARQGDFRRSHELLEELQHIAIEAGDKHEEHKLLINLAQTHAAGRARSAAVQALSRAESLLPDDAMAACERQRVQGMIEYFCRDFRSAATALEVAADMARKLGSNFDVCAILHGLGDVLLRLEDRARAYAALQQSLALAEESGTERFVSLNRVFLAYLDGLAGSGAVEGVMVQGIRYAEANDFLWDALSSRALYADLLMRRREFERAHEAYARLRQIALAAGNSLIVEDCDAAFARLEAR